MLLDDLGGDAGPAEDGIADTVFAFGSIKEHLVESDGAADFRVEFAEINLDRLQDAIDAKALDAKSTINAEALVKSGVIRRAKAGVRLLGRGEIKAKLNIEVYGASKSAIAAVEKAGGTVKILAPAKDEGAEQKAS